MVFGALGINHLHQLGAHPSSTEFGGSVGSFRFGLLLALLISSVQPSGASFFLAQTRKTQGSLKICCCCCCGCGFVFLGGWEKSWLPSSLVGHCGKWMAEWEKGFTFLAGNVLTKDWYRKLFKRNVINWCFLSSNLCGWVIHGIPNWWDYGTSSPKGLMEIEDLMQISGTNVRITTFWWHWYDQNWLMSMSLLIFIL